MKRIIIVFVFISIISGCAFRNINHIKPDDNKKEVQKLSNNRIIFDNIDENDMLWMSIDADVYEMAKEAVSLGADVNKYSKKRYYERVGDGQLTSSPLLGALSLGRYQIAEYLIESGADVNWRNADGRDILQYCAQFYPKIIEKVLEAGADITHIDKKGFTALDYAVIYTTDNTPRKAFDILMDYGAIPTDKTISLLTENVTDEKYGMLRRILSMPDDTGTQLIDKAVRDAFLGDGESAQKSIMSSTNRDLALHGVAAFCDTSAFKNVITNRDDISSLLVTAVKYSNTDIVKYILDNYKDIDVKGPMDKTILYYAAEHNNTDILNALNESNISIDKFWGAESAIASETIGALKWLLDNGLDKGKYNTLLKSACQYGNYDVIKLLLDYGANVNGGDISCKGDPLKTAVQYGYSDVVKLLMEYGVDANCSSEAESALMVAIRYGQFDCVKLLVEKCNADINYTYEGTSVLDKAYECGSQRIYDYLATLS